MGTIRINGVTYSGDNLIVNGNKVVIDGRDVTPEEKEITITVNGNLENLNVGYCKEIHVVEGNVNTLTTTSGNVYCKDITGNVETTSGDIECSDIHGNVETTSGDVLASLISGTVSTVSGDVRYKK
jgi:hypothetical protein